MSTTAPGAALAALLVLAFLSVITPCTAKIRWGVNEDRQKQHRIYTIEMKRNPSLSFDDHQQEDKASEAPSVQREDRCCGLGYRSQWMSWEGRRRVISYCPERLSCCSHLVDKEIEMWGGFGFTLCIQPEEKSAAVKINPFTRYLNYYEENK